jgi:squalene cyclase
MERNDIIKWHRELAVRLLEKRNREGYWTGRLSSSALGVAVAITAFHFHDKDLHRSAIEKGTAWLVSHQNRDGGYGDTPESISNLSTSLLVNAAFNILDKQIPGLPEAGSGLSAYISSQGIDINSPQVARAILNHYKTDYTFSVPILVMGALCGIPSRNAFASIPQLPFELALLPRNFYKMLTLGVVSYAIPALIAVGIAIFHNKPKRNPVLGFIRRKAIPGAIRRLESLMPESGGFLEAMPLTGFVSMCLIASGHKNSPVVQKGISFLQLTQREDGSWPIDIDLSNWVTALSVKSLLRFDKYGFSVEDGNNITRHILSQQYKQVHPFNGAMPGGWGWTHHSGSVPDGDDTPGAIISLIEMNRHQPGIVKPAVMAGCNWLLNLQNSDGGFPTFVKGWGKLPFDQSCADLTGHGILALALTLDMLMEDLPSTDVRRYNRAIRKGLAYLRKNQDPAGALLPLWFGNQGAKEHLNPVYGTARVLTYLDDMSVLGTLPQQSRDEISEIISKGRNYLASAQNRDGSWGGDTGVAGTIEETSLALGALSSAGADKSGGCLAAIAWLRAQTSSGVFRASPIGLYFASLWYDEELYPLTALLDGVGRFLENAESDVKSI